MKNLHRVLSALLILLGTVHVVLTPLFEEWMTLAALWFCGTGMALIYQGMLNLVAGLTERRLVWFLTLLANLLGMVFAICLVVAVREPQAWVACGLNAVLVISSSFILRNGARRFAKG